MRDFRFRSRRFEAESDRSVIVGIAMALALIAFGIALGGNVLSFVNIPSFVLVVGGTLGATLANYSTYDLKHAWQACRNILQIPAHHPVERIRYLVSLSQLVKKNGLLTLEAEGQRSDDPFLKLALGLTVDGQNQEDIKRILETEMRVAHDRSMRAVQVLETMGTYAPAMGLIGTLTGLIQMLGTLNNPATVGPAMALALVTTFYGSLLANVVFNPIAGKLRNRSEEAAVVKSMTVEGVMSLGKQENPLILEQKLQGFLPLAAHG